MEKRCSKCEMVLPSTEFHRSKRYKDGLQHKCKKCSAEYYARNRDKVSAQGKKRRDENKEYHLERNRKYRVDNRLEIANRLKELRERNPERLAEYQRKYRENNRYKNHVRDAVTKAIKRLDLPPAHGLVCESCQEAQAQHYHHHNGYAPEHALDVVALCTECHGKCHRIDGSDEFPVDLLREGVDDYLQEMGEQAMEHPGSVDWSGVDDVIERAERTKGRFGL